MKIVNEPIKVHKSLVIERSFLTAERHYGVCVFTDLLHRCGYVGVNPDHFAHGLGYIDFNDVIAVHGGLTFSNYLEIKELEVEGLWFFGFDCGHSWDARDKEAGEKYGFVQNSFYALPDTKDSVVRDLEYVMREVEYLSSQLTPQAMMRNKMERIKEE